MTGISEIIAANHISNSDAGLKEGEKTAIPHPALDETE
jgi:hypothetical protein